MCGRFTLYATAEELASLFGLGREDFREEARYNIAPGQWVVIVRPGRMRSRARWGLVPPWARGAGPREAGPREAGPRPVGPKPINARAEGIAGKPLFRDALRHGRCLIPASGFYEWQGKRPFYIRPVPGPLFAFAGLASAGPEETCAILTTTPNGLMAPIHDRMPVILAPEAWARWLDPGTPEAEALALLGPCPAEGLVAHPVSPRVGSVANEGPGLIAPLPVPKDLFGGPGPPEEA